MSKKEKAQTLEKDLNSVLKMTCEGLEPPTPTRHYQDRVITSGGIVMLLQTNDTVVRLDKE
ncbi:hypothetical protein ASG99_21690 [Bacillus sp. Soil768D1]|nr:hypothetical protein ASG99_21690 [Bacillus sp. Soil768D1]